MRTAAPWCAFASIATLAVAAAAAAAAATAGCTASAEDVRPPQDQLAFPTGLAVTADQSALFVVNANSELRYDSGSIGVIDLQKVEMVIANWMTGATTSGFTCNQDPEHAETLVCEEAAFFRIGAGVRIGNFATSVALQDFTAFGGGLRLFVPTRGDPSVAWADYDGSRLRCNSTSDSYPLCDDAHRLTSLDNDPDLDPLPTEPFSVFAHVTPATADTPARGFAMVGHIATGSVTLINSPPSGDQVRIVDMLHNLFAPDISTGVVLRGASTIAGRKPQGAGATDELIYVASSTEDRVLQFTVGELDGAASYLLPGNFFFLNAVGNTAGNSSDTRGIAFSPSGDRLYLVNRMPPSVQVYDTTDTPTGQPRNTPLGSSDVCREASTIAVADLGPDVGQRVYVTCFQDGEVYVVDPAGQSRVEDIISVGRGPYATAVIHSAPGQAQLLVSNFLEDTIAVIDLSPTSPKRNRVVLRIGTPRIP